MKRILLVLLIYIPQINVFSQDIDPLVLDHDTDLAYTQNSTEFVLGNDKCSQEISGFIIDSNENTTISNAQIRILRSYNEPIDQFSADDNGFFRIKVPCNKLLHFEANHQDYGVRYKKLLYTNPKKPDYFKMYLLPLSSKKQLETALSFIEPKDIPIINRGNLFIIDVPQIYFGLNEVSFDEESMIIISQLAAILKANPKVIIEIASHTDGRGPDDYELELSQKRANYIKNKLLQNDIAFHRLIPNGYGGNIPLNICFEDDKCNEKQNLANRRTEFVILNPIKTD